jgi:hypothetical protein
MKIYLSIKAQDILTSNYTDARDCAITRALDRAGYSNLRHEGVDIVNAETREVVFDRRDKKFVELGNLVWDMYDAKEENQYQIIRDFQFTLSK